MTHLPHGAAGGLITGFVQQDVILGGKDLVFEPATIKSGANVRPFSVLGQILVGAATAAAKSGGNTGTGTFTIDATTPTLAGAKVGVYTLRCIQVITTNSYLFRLLDPDGISVGVYNLTGSGGSITIADQIKGALADGGTDFVVGDGFDITVPVGSLKYTLSLAAALDGSQIPAAINLEYMPASGADVTCPVVVEGYFNEEALVYGTGHTADTVRVALRNRGIHLKTMRYSG
jgi:hypothetical protein